jgi:hypothetical protein
MDLHVEVGVRPRHPRAEQLGQARLDIAALALILVPREPGYDLALEPVPKGAEPALRMRRNDSKNVRPLFADIEEELADQKVSSRKLLDVAVPIVPPTGVKRAGDRTEPTVDAKALIRRALVGLSDAATCGYMTEDNRSIRVPGMIGFDVGDGTLRGRGSKKDRRDGGSW